jgi:hypothetical protein
MLYFNNDLTYFDEINKCKEIIKNEEKKIADSKFIIDAINEKMVDTVKSVYLPYTGLKWDNLYNYIHETKNEFIDKYKDEETNGIEIYKKAKSTYNMICSIICNEIIKNTECVYSKTKIVTDHFIFGYDWGYEFIFEVNNIKFIFYIPNTKALNVGNFYDACEGKYCLDYYKSEYCSCRITSSYNLEDLSEAFKEFIESNNNG